MKRKRQAYPHVDLLRHIDMMGGILISKYRSIYLFKATFNKKSRTYGTSDYSFVDYGRRLKRRSMRSPRMCVCV